jgi:hypothetical protein
MLFDTHMLPDISERFSVTKASALIRITESAYNIHISRAYDINLFIKLKILL